MNNNDCKCTNNVSCGVKGCRYHETDDSCRAEHISVKNESAQRMAETFCGTFCARTDD
jgi:hypothetical protein